MQSAFDTHERKINTNKINKQIRTQTKSQRSFSTNRVSVQLLVVHVILLALANIRIRIVVFRVLRLDIVTNCRSIRRSWCTAKKAKKKKVSFLLSFFFPLFFLQHIQQTNKQTNINTKRLFSFSLKTSTTTHAGISPSSSRFAAEFFLPIISLPIAVEGNDLLRSNNVLCSSANEPRDVGISRQHCAITL